MLNSGKSKLSKLSKNIKERQTKYMNSNNSVSYDFYISNDFYFHGGANKFCEYSAISIKHYINLIKKYL